MSTTSPRRAPLFLVLLVGVLAWLATAGTAQAHSGLTGSTPAEGSTVTDPLTVVTLSFSAAVRGPDVTVAGPDGAAVATAEATVDGSTVSVPVSPTATGPHTVTWAVTSADGHRLEGTVGFTYAGPVPTTAAPATTSAAATTAAPAAPTTPTPEQARPSEAAATTADGEDDGGSSTAALVAAGVVVLAAGGGTLALRRRR